jgi:hypothetical protein
LLGPNPRSLTLPPRSDRRTFFCGEALLRGADEPRPFLMFEIVLIVFAFASVFAFVEWWKGPDIPTS